MTITAVTTILFTQLAIQELPSVKEHFEVLRTQESIVSRRLKQSTAWRGTYDARFKRLWLTSTNTMIATGVGVQERSVAEGIRIVADANGRPMPVTESQEWYVTPYQMDSALPHNVQDNLRVQPVKEYWVIVSGLPPHSYWLVDPMARGPHPNRPVELPPRFRRSNCVMVSDGEMQGGVVLVGQYGGKAILTKGRIDVVKSRVETIGVAQYLSIPPTLQKNLFSSLQESIVSIKGAAVSFSFGTAVWHSDSGKLVQAPHGFDKLWFRNGVYLAERSDARLYPQLFVGKNPSVLTKIGDFHLLGPSSDGRCVVALTKEEGVVLIRL